MSVAVISAPCSSDASSADATPLPDTSATTADQQLSRDARLHRSSRRPPGKTPRCCRWRAAIRPPADLPGKQALLDGARQPQFLLHLLLALLPPAAAARFPARSRPRWRASAAVRDCRPPGPRRSGANPCRARRPSRCRSSSTLVASLWPARMRTSGTQITLRSSRSAMLFCGRVSSAPTGSKFIDSSSRRFCSARWITCRGTRRSLSRRCCPRALRATRVSRPLVCRAAAGSRVRRR